MMGEAVAPVVCRQEQEKEPMMVTISSVDAARYPVHAGNVRALSELIRPTPEEQRWREIPWQTDLREACRIASDTGKPIFLWAMNGNPLGCT